MDVSAAWIFFGLFAALVVVMATTGQWSTKHWEFEADLREPTSGAHIAEFEIELSRWLRKEEDYSLKAELEIDHEICPPGETLRVFIEDVLVLRGPAGAVRTDLDTTHLTVTDITPSEGQVCRLFVGEHLVAEGVLAFD